MTTPPDWGITPVPENTLDPAAGLNVALEEIKLALTEIDQSAERVMEPGANIAIDRTDPDAPVIRTSAVLSLASYTVAGAPDAAATPNGVIKVSDGDGGDPCVAVSDGTTWRRVVFGATISAT